VAIINYLVIGASSGIGRQVALQLSESGHKVYGTYNNNEIQDVNIEYHQVNILSEKLSFEFLPDTMHGMVYCPGSINLRPFARLKPEQFVADYNLQVLGAIKSIQAVLPRLKAVDNSSIVLFSTVAVQAGFNFHSLVSTSKGALEGLTKSLAAEFAPQIRVNCIAPSLTDTPLAATLLRTDEKREVNANRHPLKKIGTPKDIANMVEYILSPKAGWITGQIIHVDGGMSTVKI
jgi:NAD(P)-dependent dehydrogenase (short-subunit alcohol dehydrogenase family)